MSPIVLLRPLKKNDVTSLCLKMITGFGRGLGRGILESYGLSKSPRKKSASTDHAMSTKEHTHKQGPVKWLVALMHCDECGKTYAILWEGKE